MSEHHYTEAEKLHYYEGDQSKLYSGILGHHDDINSQASKDKVKQIWKITGILTAITIVEVGYGLFLHTSNPSIPHLFTIIFFLALTVIKAKYIVSIFMHLGDENKTFAKIVIYPLAFILWVIVAYLIDAQHALDFNETFAHVIKNIVK